MDESIQKQIEAALPKMQQSEHWRWVWTSMAYCYVAPPERCRFCEEARPQSREQCLANHGTFGGYMERA